MKQRRKSLASSLKSVCCAQGLYHVQSKWAPVQPPQELQQAAEQRLATNNVAGKSLARPLMSKLL